MNRRDSEDGGDVVQGCPLARILRARESFSESITVGRPNLVPRLRASRSASIRVARPGVQRAR